ncbi:autophagy-related protein 17 [Umbelopsis sp. PMI_123]|nr:autophagy-related protein 17 [Umbelopsis sp. PMI_123]
MEQELISILLFAKKALQTGQAICEQANQCTKDSSMFAENLEAHWSKLIFLSEHITTQLNTLVKIHDFIILTAGDLQGFIKTKEAALGNLSLAVQQTFDSLKKSSIDPDILRVNLNYLKAHNIDQLSQNESYTDKKSLFDYIDDQAVLELQQKTDDEISAVEALRSTLQGMAKSLYTSVQSLITAQKSFNLKRLEGTATDFAEAKKSAQEAEITHMADILTSLTNHYDQVGSAMKVFQSKPSEHLDISVLQDDHDRVPDIIENLQTSLQEVEAIREDMRAQLDEYNKIYDSMARLFSELERIGESKGPLDSIFDRLIRIEVELQERKDVLNNYFQNLWGLVDWYIEYAVSYDYLTLEITRRQRVQLKQAKLLEECRNQFDDFYQEELEQRRQWDSKHGAYLPTDLCPFMREPPPMITLSVSPDSLELPVISAQALEEALQRTENYESAQTQFPQSQ